MTVSTFSGPAPKADESSADEKLLSEIHAVVETQVVESYEWYRTHARGPRLLFRTAGTVVILASISLPLLATLDYDQKGLVLSLFSILIAALTGLNAFFGWEQSWRSRRQTEFALKQALFEWKLKMAVAREESDPATRRHRYAEATEELLSQANTIVGAETKEFFGRMKWPQAKTKA